jgi:branched-chain amino acid transport system substrate-binding protein
MGFRAPLRRWTVLAALLAGAVAVAGCGDDGGEAGAAASDEPFRILMVTQQSGPAESFGTSFEPGVQAGVDAVNADGGILGHRVELKLVDDQSDPAKGVTALQQELVSGTKYQMAITAFSAFTTPLAPVLAKQDVIAMTAGSAAALFGDPEKYPNLFGFSANLEAQADGIVEDAKRRGVKRVGIIAADNDAGLDVANLTKERAEAAGIAAKTVFTKPDVVDATPQVQQLQASGAEALVVMGFSPVVPAALAAKRKLGWDALTYCDQGCQATNWADMPEADWKGVLVEQFPESVEGDPSTQTDNYKRFQELVGKHTDQYLLGIVVDYIGWNMVMAAKAAAEKADSIEPAKLVETLENMKSTKEIPGYIGPEGLFSPDGRLAHVLHTTPDAYVFVEAAPTVDGLMPGPVVK